MQNLVVPFLSLAIGIIVALAVSGYKYLLDFIAANSYQASSGYAIVLFTILGGLFAGLWLSVTKTSHKQNIEGIADFVTSKATYMNAKDSFNSVVASIFSIGFGGSLGPETPSAQIGAGASIKGAQLCKLKSEDTRVLAACGVAAGISAAFNAPLAGFVFAIEVIYKGLPKSAFAFIMLSSATSSVLICYLYSESPAFIVPSFKPEINSLLISYFILGLICAFAAMLFKLCLEKLALFFDKLKIPLIAKTSIGAGIVGLTAFVFSTDILGTGYPFIEKLLSMQYVSFYIAVILFAKIFASSIMLASGNQGGLVAPSLFIGACIGLLFASILSGFYEHVLLSSFALIGMGAFLAGLYNAPLLGIILPFEMTQNYEIILPLSICVSGTLAVLNYVSNKSV